MPTELTSPLSAIIAAAAARNVQGPAAKLRKRMDHATDTVVVLADCSGSMLDAIGSGGLQSIISKFDHLTVALRDVVNHNPAVRIIAFATGTREITVDEIATVAPGRGHLGSSTDLARAVDAAAKLRPRKTIIICDGQPDNEAEAFAAVERLTGMVDTIFCGPDNAPEIAFLRALARSGGGAQYTWSGQAELAGVVRLALPAPAEVR